jgi:hypothetical protein
MTTKTDLIDASYPKIIGLVKVQDFDSKGNPP